MLIYLGLDVFIYREYPSLYLYSVSSLSLSFLILGVVGLLDFGRFLPCFAYMYVQYHNADCSICAVNIVLAVQNHNANWIDVDKGVFVLFFYRSVVLFP